MLALVAALSLSAVVRQDTVPEPVVIELSIGRITSTTVQAYRVRSECCCRCHSSFSSSRYGIA